MLSITERKILAARAYEAAEISRSKGDYRAVKLWTRRAIEHDNRAFAFQQLHRHSSYRVEAA